MLCRAVGQRRESALLWDVAASLVRREVVERKSEPMRSLTPEFKGQFHVAESQSVAQVIVLSRVQLICIALQPRGNIFTTTPRFSDYHFQSVVVWLCVSPAAAR